MRHAKVPAFVLLILGMFSMGNACETPVYRYAMYRWQPAPYEIYCFHSGERDAKSHAVEAKVQQLSEESENRANVVFLPVNVADDPDLLSVPPDVKQSVMAARQDADGAAETQPSYLVSTPYGVALHQGALDVESVERLIESPARKSLAAQLETGKVGVFLLVSGEDAEENEAARSVLQGVLADVAEGNVSLYQPPTTLGAAGGEAGAEATQPKYELGLIEVDRQSEDEQWLVRSLLTIEPDLKEEKRPMTFLVYGRARALLPYIGPGISSENLLREVEFVSGACSCTVKEQNPGVDLLVRYDWESAAAALAESVGSEEGNESSLGGDMFFPELFIPSTTQTSVAASGDEVAAASGASELPGQDEPAAPGTAEVADVDPEVALSNAAGDGDRSSDAAGDLSDDGAKNEPAGDELANVAQPAVNSAPPEVQSNLALSSVLMMGAGLIGAMIVLFGITLIVLRPQ